MAGETERIGELLIEEGVITQEELTRAIADGGVKGSALAAALKASPHARRAELAGFLSSDFRIPLLADLRQVQFADGVAKLVPEELARKHEVVPVARIGDILCVAKPNYFNRAAVLELRRVTGMRVKVLQADEVQVRAAIDRLYRGKAGQLPAPAAKKKDTTMRRAAPPEVAPRAAMEAVPLISMPEEGEEALLTELDSDERAAVKAGAVQDAEEIIEIMEAIRIPSGEFSTAMRDPFNRMVVEFDDVFRGGRAVAPQRVV